MIAGDEKRSSVQNVDVPEKAILKSKRSWLWPVITTVLGVSATIGVGMYQISASERRADLAEAERENSIKQEVVAIIEEHILNERLIDIPRVSRLIEQRRQDERVRSSILVLDLIQQAEFNVLESRYLPFERKEAIKASLDTLYNSLYAVEFEPYEHDSPNAELFNTLAQQIQNNESAGALETMSTLHEIHVQVAQVEKELGSDESFAEFVDKVIGEPLIWYMTVLLTTSIWVILRRLYQSRLKTRDMHMVRARRFIREAIKDGIPTIHIVKILVDEGVPEEWAHNEVIKWRKLEEHS